MTLNELYHFGILGMKWGVRKAKPPESMGKRSSTKKVPEKSKVSKIPDEDLKKIVTRLNLEKQYKDLTKQEISKSKKFVSDVLGASVKQVATTYTTKALTKLVENILSNRRSREGGA